MRIRTEPVWTTARGILPSCDTWHSTSCRRMAQRRRCAASFSEPGGTTPISLASSPCSEVRLPWALSSGFETETEFSVHALALHMPVQEVRTLYRQRAVGTRSKLHTVADGLRILRAIVTLTQQEH